MYISVPFTTSHKTQRLTNAWDALKASVFFALILFSNLYGLKSFTDGFLLRREVLNSTSSCSNPPLNISQWKETSECWAPKLFSKAVIIIIDALRYDFLIPSNDSAYYLNALNTPYETSISHPEQSVLLQFLADAPTTTSQRLKGLTTGSLPTFIDIGSNFAGTNVDEDNLLYQWKSLGKEIVLLGDDTWNALFHDYLNHTYSRPAFSFNVPDLHGVDRKVNRYIFDYIEKAPWDILIAHYLGVDHVGHRLGPNHPTMTEKLKEMNECIKKTMDLIDDDTLLLVMGDHGMDGKGNHGGDSFDEINSVLWMYSKRPAFKPFKQFGERRSVNQVDLVPTLSLMLGNAIPFGSLGTIIPEAFYFHGAKYLHDSMEINMAQINRFLQAYEDKQETSYDAFVNSTVQTDDNYLELFLNSFTDSQRIFDYFKSIWAEFSLAPMVIGFVSLVIGGLSLALLMNDKNATQKASNVLIITLKKIVLFSLLFVVLKMSILTYLPMTLITLIPNIIIIIELCRKVSFEFMFTIPSIYSVIALGLAVLHVCSFGSNSFTIWEDRLTHYFCVTLGGLMLCKSFTHTDATLALSSSVWSIFFIILQLLTSYITNCREEQEFFCTSTYISTPENNFRSLITLTISTLTSFFLPYVLKNHVVSVLKTSFSKRKQAILHFFEFLSSFFWVVQHILANNSSLESKYGSILVYIANIFLIGIITCLSWQVFMFSVYIKRENKSKNREALIAVEEYYFIFALFSSLLLFLQRPLGKLSLVSCLLQIFILLRLENSQSSPGVTFTSVLLSILGLSHFFTTGNQAVISSLDWNFAFIHSSSAENQVINGVLMFLHTLGGPILTCFSLPLFAAKPYTTKQTFFKNLLLLCSSFLLYYLSIAASTVFFAGFFRRHLMVWKIFAPRFMLNGILLITQQLIILILCFWNSLFSFS
ncbi:pig-O [Schizosaccharomyces cryophilus OY26]|uniref:Pig-O n=1 Tax=Schizosaccharomyces cryophilus (strain OY26 / ATCC MYA-4695 / CBS 11777 / NBRC 106824 / NRRL Y48691) TaxID=653667 RepID=S9WX23_SCHCR|nr:pig-O [Schizosaccharomyces cryophilus OY26]EPY49287.1 pig-O [Schizosaccharomyces cryophilus OY26]